MSQGLNNDIAVSKTRRVVKNLRWWVLVLFFTWRYRQLHHTQLAGNYRAGTKSDPRHYYRTILVDRRRVSAGLHDFPAAVRLAYRRHRPEAWLYDLRHPVGAGLYRPRRGR